MIIMGIDPSIDSSGICKMYLDSDFGIEKLVFYGYCKTKKWCINTENVKITCVGTKYPKLTIYERIDLALEVFDEALVDVDLVSIEDFSYGSQVSNSTYQIGEFVGAVRKNIFDKGIPIFRYSPISIKMFATGAKNASKYMMMRAFIQKYPEIFPSEIENSLKLDSSPQVDLNDAFWIAEILRNKLKIDGEMSVADTIFTKMNKSSTKKAHSLLEIHPEIKSNLT